MVVSKKAIRKAMKKTFAQMDEKVHQEISKQLQEELFQSHLWKNANSIGVYLSVGREWDTRNIVNQALAESKRVGVPKTIPETKEMIFYEMNDWSQINEKGYFGLQEPNIETTQPLQKDEIELLIVPGLVFTTTGYRIGFGGGYYDRYLEDFIHPTVSIVHTRQFVETLPLEPFDIPVQYLVTEKGLLE